VPFLGELPIVQSIREAGDVGRPAVLQDGTAASQAFNGIIGNFVKVVEEHRQKLPKRPFVTPS
jgi:ATP-binding protein involved in chromosome partitioning